VISKADPKFWHLYDALPLSVRAAARRAFKRFQADPGHPSLNFKPLKGDADFVSVRISLKYRAVGRRKGEVVAWFWIGSHGDFDREFS